MCFPSSPHSLGSQEKSEEVKFQLRRRRTEDGQREKQVQSLQGKREHSRCEKKARVELRKPEGRQQSRDGDGRNDV